MDAMFNKSRRSVVDAMSIPAAKQEQDVRGRLPVNDLPQCGCEVRHLALRQLMYAGESDQDSQLAERVTQIKTKFSIGEREQDDLFQAARMIVKMLDDKQLLSDSSFKTSCAVEKALG